ncbi:hypothetical protein KQH50_01015 [bacterium]|nr:hypothetical protein [bacterium]
MSRKIETDMTPTPEIPRDPTQPVRPRRPLPLRLVFWVLVLWSLLGWLRFARALVDRTLIEAALSSGYFWAISLEGLIWGLSALPALWGLTFRPQWARTAILVDAVLYPALYWAERLFLWQDETARGNWPFMLALTLAWAAIVAWGLLSQRGRAYFIKELKE